jgi:glycosyltransferase involved in cell wall biosynthesis
MYFAELVRRGWAVDLVSTPLNYMTGAVPSEYRGRLYRRESIDGVMHHWVWASGRIHESPPRRALNYLTFAGNAALRGSLLPRPDVVMASSPPLTAGMTGPVLARRFRCPWVLEVRDAWPESAVSVGWVSEGSVLYRALERVAHHLASTAASVIVPTPGLVAIVERHGARSTEVVPGAVVDGVDDPEERQQTRAEYGIPASTCLFAYVGALGVANGVDLLLDSVESLPREIDAAFLLVGDGSARAALEQRVAGEDLARVRFVGALPRDRVPAILAASDVCLHLLRPDPLFASAQPTKVLEYFAARRPFITTVPGLPEKLAVESGGGFAPTAAALAAEIEKWAAMPEEGRRERGENSFRYGSERFSMTTAVDALEAILTRAFAGQPHRRRRPQP